MFKLLDRYILRKYFVTLVYVIFLFIMIVIVIDYAENNGVFIREKVPFSEVIFDYYLNFVPYVANMLSPMMVFISTIAVTARLADHVEIIAILSSGVSFFRFLLTYFVGGVIVAIIIFVLQGWVLPKANAEKLIFERKYINKSNGAFTNRHFILEKDCYAYCYTYRYATRECVNFTMERYVRDSNNAPKLLEKIDVSRLAYDTASKSWKSQLAFKRTLAEDGKYYLTTLRMMDTVINLSPEDFEVSAQKREVLTMGELDDKIAELEAKGNADVAPYYVEKYYRYAYPVAIVLLTLMGVIVSAKKSRQGAGLQIFIGFLLALLFVGFVYIMKIMGEGGDISPLTSAVTPIVVFSIVTVFLYRTVPK